MIAGNGIDVAGTGSTANPYVISAEAVNCTAVRSCLSAGDGITYNPTTGVITARPSSDAGNTVAFGADGGLLVPTPPEVTCAQVRPCVSAGDGLAYDQATGVFTPNISDDAGNNITTGTDGGLFVPTGAATVTTGCGLTGDGAAATPLIVSTGTWPYPCDVATRGGVVVCDEDGVLRSEPRGQVGMQSFFDERRFADVAVPTAAQQVAAHFETKFTNPDPCRPAFVVAFREADVWFDMPPGSSAAMGYSGDEMWYQRNSGSSANTGVHIQPAKTLPNAPSMVDPGGTVTVGFDVMVGRGSGGATYSLIQIIIRALLISL
ncbi:hypothetical protein HUT18_11465 [Streptomyces sp. NA04227]|uniref:hypothetical protein n=1 Tax=Streptomyces sp. NA04227 TaxID=2742136 RepID=UPI001590C386|nr:hypothetical protein [Streptomyces sp. NA04227]QKW06917.1 hypothetical protein HUT18_11465 [Streptomyces sp. NA04227]